MNTEQNTGAQRVQRSRQKGARLPENTVCVSRYRKDNPGKWGNPIPTGDTQKDSREVKRAKHAVAVAEFVKWLETTDAGRKMAESAARELRGKNLACWCAPDMPCHGNVLLAIANPNTEKTPEPTP